MESVVERLKSLGAQLAPPRLVSWQSMFLFGVGLWIVSAVVSLSDPENARELYILRRVGWLFIAGGIVWRQTLDPVKVLGFPIGALAASSAIITFFFENEQRQWTQVGFILWPLLSGALVTMSYFLSTSGHWRVPSQNERFKAIVALAIGLILACWMRFYFVTQDWMVQYPRLWNAQIEHSSFMSLVKDPRESLGQRLVGEVDELLYRRFNGRTWSDIEKQLQEYVRAEDGIKDDLEKEGEDGRPPVTVPLGSDWRVSFQVSGTGNPSYTLTTKTTWDSPLPFDDRDFSVIRVCEVSRAPLPLELFNESTQTGLLECNTSPEFIFEKAEEPEEPTEPAEAPAKDEPPASDAPPVVTPAPSPTPAPAPSPIPDANPNVTPTPVPAPPPTTLPDPPPAP